MNRRNLLGNLVAAPYVCRLGVLMPVHAFLIALPHIWTVWTLISDPRDSTRIWRDQLGNTIHQLGRMPYHG
jgi:hypothetical protein